MGYAAADHVSLVDQTRDFVSHFADVLMAFVGLGLLIAVSVTSVKIARRKLKRETWYFVHLDAYLGVALGFAHQLAVGTDFSDDAAARCWWVSLYVVVFGSILLWRVGRPLVFNARHRLRVHTVKAETPGVVSIDLHGPESRSDRGPTGPVLPLALPRPQRLVAGAPLLALGRTHTPPAAHHRQTARRPDRAGCSRSGPARVSSPKARTEPSPLIDAPAAASLLIAGGIGITPLRAMLDSLPGDPGDITLIYRVISDRDVLFERELLQLGSKRGIAMFLVTGSEIGDDETDKLGIPALAAFAPDVADSDCYVCGPPGY